MCVMPQVRDGKILYFGAVLVIFVLEGKHMWWVPLPTS